MALFENIYTSKDNNVHLGDRLVESSFSRQINSHILPVTNNKHDIATIIELLKDIKNNTQDTENDVWYPFPTETETVVYVGIRVVNVGDIDTVNQQFYCEFYLYARWREPKLKGRKRDEFIPWDEYWDPRIIFTNIATCDMNNRRHIFLPKDNEIPFVRLEYHVKGYFKEVLEVNDFPFDYQDLTISIIAGWRVLKHRNIRFEQDNSRPDGLRTLNFLATQEWDLQPHLVREFSKTERDPGMPDDVYPLYTVQMHARRRPSHYIYNVALVMLLIAALTFSTFIFKAKEPGERLQITLTLLLTSVAFKYVISSSLPKVSYLTLLDKYVLWCLIFHFLMSVHAVASSLIQSEMERKIFEWVCFYLAISFFVILHGVFSCIAFVKWRKVQRLMKEQNEKFHPLSGKGEELQQIIVSA